jgi:hypothetical protein
VSFAIAVTKQRSQRPGDQKLIVSSYSVFQILVVQLVPALLVIISYLIISTTYT